MGNTGLHTVDDCIPRCGIAQQHVVGKVTREPLLFSRAGDSRNAALRLKLVICGDAAEASLMKKNASVKISFGNEWKNLSVASPLAVADSVSGLQFSAKNTLAGEVIDMKRRG